MFDTMYRIRKCLLMASMMNGLRANKQSVDKLLPAVYNTHHHSTIAENKKASRLKKAFLKIIAALISRVLCQVGIE